MNKTCKTSIGYDHGRRHGCRQLHPCATTGLQMIEEFWRYLTTDDATGIEWVGENISTTTIDRIRPHLCERTLNG